MTEDLHAITQEELKRLGVWIRWTVPILLAGMAGALKYMHDMDASMNALVVNDTKTFAAILSNEKSLYDKYARHIIIHSELNDRIDNLQFGRRGQYLDQYDNDPKQLERPVSKAPIE